jgi:adenine-specific DNA methylase
MIQDTTKTIRQETGKEITAKSLIEVQFPIAQLSLESFLERDARTGKVLNSLGKWWGTKPIVLTRAVVLASLLEASEDQDRWIEDLEIFFKLMCFDNAGMWKRRNPDLKEISSTPPYQPFVELCYPLAHSDELDLFRNQSSWAPRLNESQRIRKEALQKRVFHTLSHAIQRRYCRRVEEIDGPPEESWSEINAYCGTNATSLRQWVDQVSQRRFGKKLRVGDAFSGIGSIPFAAAQIGCDVHASDLSPVSSLLTWGALNIIAGPLQFHDRVLAVQEKLCKEIDDWYIEQGFETSSEGWRGTLYFYCVEIVVPEWDNWKIPISASWQLLKSNKQIWVELIPIESQKRFDFKVHEGGPGYDQASGGTKSETDVICPQPLWEILRKQGKIENTQRRFELNLLIKNHGGIRRWDKNEVLPRNDDFYGERLYCIRWQNAEGKSVFREPQEHDARIEAQICQLVNSNLNQWQAEGWIPDWRIQEGQKTREPLVTRGWGYWHQLFTPRQLLMAKQYSERIAQKPIDVRPALILALGQILNYNARLCRWHPTGNSTVEVFYNQALNTLYNFVSRGWAMMGNPANPQHFTVPSVGECSVNLADARTVDTECQIWITDPPYADAVKYEELSEFFLGWYKPHLVACFPNWYTDSMRALAVKGDDAPFRVAMAECYLRLAQQMPDDGMQVLMFTHKSTDVWEDLALIMWAAGLQVKQVWSVATETGAGGIKKGNYVQATYNMVLRKRTSANVGFVDFITPQVNKRVREVITRMRESQIAGDSTCCGYTDTDYLLAAQATAAGVVTGYASIDGVDLDAELRTPNANRGRSALRTLMENAKRTATDFLVPPAMDRAIRKAGAGDPYAFWRQFSPEEKFLLKGLEGEAQGVFKIGAFQDLGRAYGLASYEDFLGPTRANDSRTKVPNELPRPDAIRFGDVPASDRGTWAYSPTRHIYHALKLLEAGADSDRAVKHLIDTTDFWNTRATRLSPIIAYLKETTAALKDWAPYQNYLAVLAIGVENARA